MKFKSFVCLCLLLAAVVAEESPDDWSWGEKIKDSPSSSSSVREESSSRERLPRENEDVTLDIQPSTSDDAEPLEVTESPIREVLETQSSENEEHLASETEVTLPVGEEQTEDSTESDTQNDDPQLLEVESTTDIGSWDHEPLSSLETKTESSAGSDLVFPTGEPLPLEPHEPSPEISEGADKGGLQTSPGEGGREGRFINLGETLCSYGIGFNCEPKTPAPFKNNFGVSKLDKNQVIYRPSVAVNLPYGYQQYPAGYIPSSQSIPYPPLPFDRNGNVVTTTEASSIFEGILSALEPILPGSKPEAPAKVSKGVIRAPSLPIYERPPPPYYPPVNPTYQNPQPSFVASPPAYIPVKNPYEVPQQSFASPVYEVAKPEYQDVSQSHYVVPQETYVTPQRDVIEHNAVQFNQQGTVPLSLSTAESQDTFVIPQRNFIEHNDAQISYTPTVPVAPSAVEEHHHSHTYIYDKQTLPRDIYKNDHNGLLQSVHDSINQMNEFSIPRRDNNGVSNHVNDPHDFQAAQSSVSNVIHRERPVTAPSTPSINPSTLSGGADFQPGKIERGFKPIPTSLDQLVRQREALFSEDCQCVAVAYCSEQDVVIPNVPNDLRNIIDARNTGIDILSNRTNTSGNSSIFIQSPEIVRQSSARRGKVLALPDDKVDFAGVTESLLEEETTEEATEEATEAFTESGEETTLSPLSEESLEKADSRFRRETSEEESASSEVPSDRQGRQLTGFTPGNNGCGPDYVCCRRPVFRARQQTVGLQPKYTCGRRNADGLLGRVKSVQSSTSNTEFGEYPWQAAILKRENGDLLYVCGGTLINNKYVLTAAHCVNGIHPSLLMVRLGEWDASGETEFYQHVEYRSSGVYLHPEFSAGNLHNDIAVISLEHLVDFATNPHISPVCLPGKFAEFTNRRCFATGWGKDAFGQNGKFSPILKAVEVPVMENQQCQRALQSTRLGRTFSLPEGNLCAGGEENKDTCKGDGGGPLVCSGSDGSMQLAGLVSWGIGCGNPGVPGVYVKVSHYLDWIKDMTRTS